MRFKLFRQNGALNSPSIFDSFEQGLRATGHDIVDSNEDVAVIWSVLWNGRMRNNQQIYEQAIVENKPIMIIEVGNLLRGDTWRICLNHINGLGTFGNDIDLDVDRPNKLGVKLFPENFKRNSGILIATQHEKSLQWKGMPSMTDWTISLIDNIRKYTDRTIYIRPHPRSLMNGIEHEFKNVIRQSPQHVKGSYDDFDINYNYHCVINHNSGPPILAAIAGTPIITGTSSLAYPVSDVLENIENPKLKDREDWFLRVCHCEWTVDEISRGIPIKRLEKQIESQLNS
jgi:hypothetical protein